jgi:hypothetical protein
MTVQDVVMIRFQQETSTVRTALESLSGLIPIRYRLLLDLLQFFFWAFLWMTFFMVFTFMGYGRAIMDMPVVGHLPSLSLQSFRPRTRRLRTFSNRLSSYLSWLAWPR